MVILCSEFCSEIAAKINSRHSAVLSFRHFLVFCNVNCLIVSYERIDDRARRDHCDHFVQLTA